MLYDKLKRDYPKLVPEDFYFECGEGWYDLLNNLLSIIDSECRHKSIIDFHLTQVKEKFGGLRFYYDGGNTYIDGAVAMAENMSYHICEHCGEKGEINKQGWRKVRCKDHE